jgi:putative pyoverdin transport system ATP-binding/permease protein
MILFFVFIGLLLFALPAIQHISAAALTGYTLAALYLYQPLDFLTGYLPIVSRTEVALRKVETLGLSLTEAEPWEADSPVNALAARPVVECVGVTHSYVREGEDGRFVLGPIDLKLAPGELVFVVGGNGSGKTTLAKLLTGLYTPESGEIRVNGAPVTDALREGYRQHFSAVFSDFYVFDTLLGLASPELAPRVHAYLERLQLDSKVKVERGALSTVDLSQGQRKRLALLTAYLEARPICVFDEWAADQDPTFKDIFYRELLPELRERGKTVVVITHDDRYFSLADRVLRLESGQLVGSLARGASLAND